MRFRPRALSSLLSIFLLLELTGSASSITPIETKPLFQSQGRIGIYDARADQMRELNAEYAKVSRSLERLHRSYASDHPKVIAVENHFKLLKSEIEATRKTLEELGEQLSEDERSFLLERYQTNLEIEAGRRRMELAKLKTRYKAGFPSVIEATVQLEEIETLLTDFREKQSLENSHNINDLEQFRTEASLARVRARLQSLRMRYRDKHPFIIEAKAQIQELEDQLATTSDQAESTHGNDSHTPRALSHERQQEEISLVREEIQLVEEHLEQGLKSHSSDAKTLSQEQLELLKLKQELAVMEGNRQHEAASLREQRTLLEQLLMKATSPEDTFQLKRQLIRVKRAQLQIPN